MQTIKLYGHLAKKFGKSFTLDVKSPAEAIRALRANFSDFEAALVGHPNGYNVIIDTRDIGEEDLRMNLHEKAVMKIVPVVAGAGGALRVIGGVVLAVVGAYFQQPWLVSIGVSLALGGVASLLTKAPKVPTNVGGQEVTRATSYSFNGPVNTTAQGNPVPVCYGRMIIGSQVISAGLSVEQLAV